MSLPRFVRFLKIDFRVEMPVISVPKYDKTAATPVNTEIKPNKSITSDRTDSDNNNANKDDVLTSEKGKVLSKETLDSAFAGMNSKLKMQRTRCEYDYDEATNRVSIKVYDKDTDELVLEAPPEKSIEALKKTLELAGIIVDGKY